MEGAGGRDIHPKSTHGVLIRVYPVDSYQGKRTDQDYDSDSPGLSGISRVIITVNDMDHAVSVYGYKLGMEIAEPSVDDQRGILSTICTPPTGGKIELVCVEDETRPFAKSIMEFLVSNQEGMYGLVMQSNNLEATQKILSSRGLKINSSVNSPDAVEIERCATFGALIRIEAA